MPKLVKHIFNVYLYLESLLVLIPHNRRRNSHNIYLVYSALYGYNVSRVMLILCEISGEIFIICGSLHPSFFAVYQL